jgi:hypothetical protein
VKGYLLNGSRLEEKAEEILLPELQHLEQR